MSGVPKDIPGLGSSAGRPKQNPQFTPDSGFTTQDYFVWTRCDGATSMRDVILMVGFGADKGIQILQKLHDCGAVLLEGETPESVAARIEQRRAERREAESSTRAGSSSDAHATGDDLGQLDAEEQAAMSEEVALSESEKIRVLSTRRRVRQGTYYDILGVEPTARKRELKRAYFRLSKAFHPDRYYKKQTGAFGPWLTEIFEMISRAFSVLSDDRERRRYEALLRGEDPQAAYRPRTPQEHALDLFDRACRHEIAGQLDEAMKWFAAVVRVDPKPRYLRRAASCGVKAGELVSAEAYAKKAAELEPGDPSTARALASVYRAADKLEDAERTLVAALELKADNDSLVDGLKSDLAEVRRARRAK